MKIIEDVLSNKIIEKLHNIVSYQKHRFVWKTNLQAWNPIITDNSIGNVTILDINAVNNDFYKELHEEVNKYCPVGYMIISILYYEWNPLSQINWHVDSLDYDRYGFTIYLNSHWDRNWGGFLCCEESPNSDIYKMYIPRFNTGILIEPNVNHHVSLISPFAQSRRTIQVWMKPLNS